MLLKKVYASWSWLLNFGIMAVNISRYALHFTWPPKINREISQKARGKHEFDAIDMNIRNLCF
jgi:hypothetical protein